jgi:hypothetical protein
LNTLLLYTNMFCMDGRKPGAPVLDPLSYVPYNSDSAYAKRTNSKNATYFAKFKVPCNIGGTVIHSKYVAVEGVYMDLLSRPEIVKEQRSTYAQDYETLYFPFATIKTFLESTQRVHYQLDQQSLNVDHRQRLVSVSCQYATEEIPTLTVYRRAEVESDDEDEDGDKEEKDGKDPYSNEQGQHANDADVEDQRGAREKYVLEKTQNIYTMYQGIRSHNGAIFAGIAYGEFGVSRQVPPDAPVLPRNSTLKLTFKILGYHALRISDSYSLQARQAEEGHLIVRYSWISSCM